MGDEIWAELIAEPDEDDVEATYTWYVDDELAVGDRAAVSDAVIRGQTVAVSVRLPMGRPRSTPNAPTASPWSIPSPR